MHGLPMLIAALLAGAAGEQPAENGAMDEAFRSRMPVVPVEDGVHYTMTLIEGPDVDPGMVRGYQPGAADEGEGAD